LIEFGVLRTDLKKVGIDGIGGSYHESDASGENYIMISWI